MVRARELAALGPRGLNPQVGAVILSPAGEVLSEGWHHGAGTPHAEVEALRALAPGAAQGATAVVTLEPCNHTGRTGPCAQALIASGVARVVYASADPGRSSSDGAATLHAAGIDTERLDVTEGDALIADWLHVQHTGLPRVTVKWAQSLDGRAAADDGTSQWITGPAARAHVHAQRSAHDAIAVGTGTVLADDPALTARIDGDPDAPQPIPVVIGSREIPLTAAVHRHPRGVRLLHAGRHGQAGLRDAFAELAHEGIQSVYVEGGPTLASSVIREGLADTLHIYVAPTLLGGHRTTTSDLGVATITAQRRLDVQAIEPLGDDLLIVAHPRKEH